MSGTDHPLIIALTNAFREAADPDIAVFQQAYMKDKFPFFGIKTEERRLITGSLFKQHKISDHKELVQMVKKLWKLPQREYHYAGQELIWHNKNLWTDETVELLAYCITHHSWWDTVDYLAATLAGAWFKKFPSDAAGITREWNRSPDLWLNRASLLYQLKYKKQTDTKLLAEYIKRHAASKEFFHQKAIGWILREYSKTDPAWVGTFIDTHPLAPLSVREGSKYI